MGTRKIEASGDAVQAGFEPFSSVFPFKFLESAWYFERGAA